MSNNTNLKADDFRFVAGGFMVYIKKLRDDDRLSELEKYIPDEDNARWNMEKAKIVLEVS